jgi:hypothetical protein
VKASRVQDLITAASATDASLRWYDHLNKLLEFAWTLFESTNVWKIEIENHSFGKSK